jgi:hypothetical protein
VKVSVNWEKMNLILSVKFSVVFDVKKMNIELTNLNLILRTGSFQNHLMQARHKWGKLRKDTSHTLEKRTGNVLVLFLPNSKTMVFSSETFNNCRA